MMNVKTDVEHLNADIVVIGGGGAGLAAAVTVAEKGASVIVVEKRKTPGGNSNFAEGFFAAESPAQERMLIDARKDELFKMAMEYAHWTLNPRIVRAFINKSGDTVRWLESKGLVFDWVTTLNPNKFPLVWHCLKGRGAAIIKVLSGNCEDLKVRVLYDTAAKKLLVDKLGRVQGILALSGNKEVEILAGNTIIASGGYGGNVDLLKQYFPHYVSHMKCLGIPHTGDGLIMAREIGADTEGLGNLHLVGPDFAGSSRIAAVATEPDTVWVDRNGERFTDEAIAYNVFESVNTMFRLPGKVSYSIFDENIKQNITTNGVKKGSGILIIPPRTVIPELDTLLRQHMEKGTVMIADSWDGIAGYMGAESNTLNNTVKEYNSYCERGIDIDFAKDRRFLVPLQKPPFYAIRCYPDFLGTIGGIKINHNMEVISTSGKPIPCLFAAGVDTGGWESETYCAALSGSTFGFALNSGRIAGENAVSYAKSIQ